MNEKKIAEKVAREMLGLLKETDKKDKSILFNIDKTFSKNAKEVQASINAIDKMIDKYNNREFVDGLKAIKRSMKNVQDENNQVVFNVNKLI